MKILLVIGLVIVVLAGVGGALIAYGMRGMDVGIDSEDRE